MKKLVLVIAITLLLALSACSLQQYLPDDNQSPVFTLNDTFTFTNETVADENLTMTYNNETDINVSQNDSQEDSTDDSEELSNDTYVLSTITVTEGDIASLKELLAEDPDGDSVEYTYSEPFSEMGLWQTNDGDEGKYLVTITASDGLLSTTENIQVVVLPSNKGPVIECPSEMTFKEGDFVDLDCLIYDREGDEVSYTVTGFMHEMTYQSSFKDAGMHTVVVEATDGNRTNIKVIELTFEDVNRVPEVEPVDEIIVEEGDVVELSIEATDKDNDDLVVVYPLVFDEDGLWQTEKGDAGNYELEAFVSDGKDDVAVPISIIIEKLNVAPEINNIAELEDIVVEEGDTIVLDIDAVDEDGDALEIEFSGFMTTDTYTTTYDDAGEYIVTVTVKDTNHEVSHDISITVLNKNRPPVFVVN